MINSFYAAGRGVENGRIGLVQHAENTTANAKTPAGDPATRHSQKEPQMAANTDWQAKQYVLFESERTRPVRDLLAAVPATDVRSAVDLGCGPGNSTETLAAHAPGAAIRGLDSSADMIAAARQRLPQFQFDASDISTWDDAGPYDLILANAVLQWVPEHERLFPALVQKLAAGGSLAVQMPDNLDEPAHRLLREIAAHGPWAQKLQGAERTQRFGADWYYRLLKPLCARVDVWRTVYHHPLAGGAGAVVEWFKGSSLRPFLARLDDAEQQAFLQRYEDEIANAYPALPDRSVLLPFPRLFIVATR
jgi:trans-aconitate 2-methyltransferase